MVDVAQLFPVTYMNSTAGDQILHRRAWWFRMHHSNAAAVMKWAFSQGEKILFLPDEHLGRNTGFPMGVPLDQMVVWDPIRNWAAIRRGLAQSQNHFMEGLLFGAPAVLARTD